jgi:hypothetical protein
MLSIIPAIAGMTEGTVRWKEFSLQDLSISSLYLL